jgi:hypothetical protein
MFGETTDAIRDAACVPVARRRQPPACNSGPGRWTAPQKRRRSEVTKGERTTLTKSGLTWSPPEVLCLYSCKTCRPLRRAIQEFRQIGNPGRHRHRFEQHRQRGPHEGEPERSGEAAGGIGRLKPPRSSRSRARMGWSACNLIWHLRASSSSSERPELSRPQSVKVLRDAREHGIRGRRIRSPVGPRGMGEKNRTRLDGANRTGCAGE